MSNDQPTQEKQTAKAERYEEELREINKAIDAAKAKIEDGRIRNPEHEKVRVKQWRALGYLIRTKHKITKDQHLEELDEEIEEALSDHAAEWPITSD